MIRRASPRDIKALADEWRPYLVADGVVSADRTKTRKLVAECVSGGYAVYSSRTGNNGNILGGLLAMRHQRLWRPRLQATVVAWWAIDGTGMTMFRRFLEWCDQSAAIRTVAVSCEIDYSPTLLRVLSRYGFEPGILLTRKPT